MRVYPIDGGINTPSPEPKFGPPEITDLRMAEAAATVVISVLNEGDRLRETVESVLSADHVPREILVVDDGSNDRCVDTVSAQFFRARGVRVFRREHMGIAPARNFGASHAQEPALVFLDAHCAVDPGWLEPLLAVVEGDSLRVAVPVIASGMSTRNRGCGARITNDLLAYRWEAPGRQSCVGVAPGGCFAVARDTFASVGALAEMADFGFEDVEFSLRAWRLGHDIVTAPDSVIRHDFRTSAPYGRNNITWLANMVATSLAALRWRRPTPDADCRSRLQRIRRRGYRRAGNHVASPTELD